MDDMLHHITIEPLLEDCERDNVECPTPRTIKDMITKGMRISPYRRTRDLTLLPIETPSLGNNRGNKSSKTASGCGQVTSSRYEYRMRLYVLCVALAWCLHILEILREVLREVRSLSL